MALELYRAGLWDDVPVRRAGAGGDNPDVSAGRCVVSVVTRNEARGAGLDRTEVGSQTSEVKMEKVRWRAEKSHFRYSVTRLFPGWG